MKYYLVSRIYDKPQRILVSTLEKAKEKLKQMFPSYLDDWCWWSNDKMYYFGESGIPEGTIEELELEEG